MCVAVFVDEEGRVVAVDESAHTPDLVGRDDVYLYTQRGAAVAALASMRGRPRWQMRVTGGQVVRDLAATPPSDGEV